MPLGKRWRHPSRKDTRHPHPEWMIAQNKDAIFLSNETARIRCVAMTFETRPDWCRREHVEEMISLGVTKVELGVQHLDDAILSCNRRGCTVADTVEANRLLRDAGLKVGFHIMPNLPGSSIEKDRRLFFGSLRRSRVQARLPEDLPDARHSRLRDRGSLEEG